MRPRWQARAGLASAVLGLAVVLVACGSAQPTSVASPGAGAGRTPLIVPPEAGLSSAQAAAVVALRQALSPLGLQLSPVSQPVRPSEPLAFAEVPRAVYRLELADPDQGFVLIYDFADTTVAAAGARQLAGFVGSGFGQTTYPVDAQFSLAQLGSSVIFSWWSAQRSSDPARAEEAFRALASVGIPVAVTK
ncbi:MAG: hypothetical protein ACXWPJ_05150 [Candidatus Limnocylindrales bacterium]